MIDPEIPRPLQDIVERELESGEKIEWIGMPKAKYFTAHSTTLFLFGVPWTAFALFWTAFATLATVKNGNGAGPFTVFGLFGLPFILIGFGMLSSPIWARRKALKTVYVITDRRVITIDGGRSTTIRSYPPSKLTDVYRKEKADGSGDVIISRRAWRDSDGDRRSEELGFLRIADVKDVERRLKELAEQGEQP